MMEVAAALQRPARSTRGKRYFKGFVLSYIRFIMFRNGCILSTRVGLATFLPLEARAGIFVNHF
jgi:hypothetical protein